jgi:hypothetical protein
VLERLESERPVVASSAVNVDESKLVPANRNAVTKCNINMNDIEIPGGKSVNCLAKWCLWDSCISAKGEGELAGIEECAVFCAGDEVLVVAKAAAAGEAMRRMKGVQEQSILGGSVFRTRRRAHDLQVIGKVSSRVEIKILSSKRGNWYE